MLMNCNDSIKSYKSLDKSYTSDELYTSLQKALKNKDEVKILKMHDHKIEQIPPEIGQLQKLEVLSINSNILKSIPPEIGELQQLRFIFMIGNDIQTLPPEIGELRNLEKLHLMMNDIRRLPLEITKLNNLKEIVLWGNDNLDMKNIEALREKMPHCDIVTVGAR